MNCLGCGKPAIAGRHRIAVDELTEVAWHPDCHALTTGCEVCTAVVAAYPKLKDQALGDAIEANNPNEAVSYGGAHFAEPHTLVAPESEV